MARIWNEYKWLIVPGVVIVMVMALYLDARSMPARAAESDVSKQEMREFVSLLRVRTGKRRGDFSAVLPVLSSIVVIHYQLRRKQPRLVIVFEDPVYYFVANDATSRASPRLSIPTVFFDLNVDGVLEKKFRIVPKEAELFTTSQSKKSDRWHYQWVVRALLEYIRASLANA